MRYLIATALLSLLASPNSTLAQTGTPAPDQEQPYTIQANAKIVQVPTTVEVKGQVLYGLKADQFRVEDNGVPQQIKLDEDSDAQGLSLVVLLQCSRSAIAEYSKLEALPGMIESLVGGAPREIALVRYGSHPELVQPFSRNLDEVNAAMARMGPCDDDKAATIDAVSYAASILANRRDRFRRAVLLISETRDHGSTVKEERVIEQLGRTNTVVNAIAFSPIKSEVVDDWHSGGGFNPLKLLFAAVQALRQNAPKTISRLSGGQYFNFTTKKGFEESVQLLSNRVHNYYLLSFVVPNDATDGLHEITVSVPEYPNAKIRARRTYWVGDVKQPAKKN
ncbi:MAG: VWA domain-containing protein [Acidobacteria bacterium]|nr:VWA domain-containing protein [Acidobacteriota bacterium]